MSDAPTETIEESSEPAPERTTEDRTWTLVSLIDDDGREPPSNRSDREALATWCAISAPWHPRLLSMTRELPRIESAEFPSHPGAREIRFLAAGAAGRLPSNYRSQIAEAGSFLVEAGADRMAAVREALAHAAAEQSSDPSEDEELSAAASDFHALGTARWWLRDLTIAMGHADGLDLEILTRETLAGALAWRSGDASTATNRLRAAFELLTQARERFYPVDSYLVDLCLLDPSTPASTVKEMLSSHVAITFLGPAQAIENLASRDPEVMAAIREAITEGWADVAGGTLTESDESLLPLESIVWQFRRGGETYRRHLDERNVETVARRRFALYRELPQIAKRCGFRFAIHLAFDAGRFPVRPESKRLWEGPDGTTLETLTRPPIGADRPAQGLFVPWKLAKSMRDDHVATLPMVHWPQPVASWYVDLRRVARYSPVLARWVTLNDYFHLTDRPFETFRPEPDEYVTPYLAQAVARRDDRPISRRAIHAAARARFDGLSALRALALATSTAARELEATPLGAVEDQLESGRFDDADAEMGLQEPLWSKALCQGMVGTGTGRPGYLVFNPLGIARRAAVLLPEAALDLRPEGPLRASQFTEDGVWAVVDLPAFGYAWVPREANLAIPPGSVGALSARDKTIRNESMIVELDAATGGVRGIRAVNEDTARIGQQLVVLGLEGPDGASLATRMRCESLEIEYGGPALVQARTRGAIVSTLDDRRIASFHQRFRLWSGRPLLEIDVELSDIEAGWLSRAEDADPWTQAIACRWAWPDPKSMLRRTCLLAPELTDADCPETPDAFDISTRRQRTALVFGGLAHHRRHGSRMLDTLLVAGRETGRSFRLGVTLDLENLFHASADLLGTAYVVPTEAGPPRTGPTGWLFQVDHKSVAVTRVEFTDASGDGRGWGVVFHLLETAGRPARCRLRCFRNPTWARQTDFNNELIVDLPMDEDAVLVDLTPHEIARVDVTLG